jgi:hypothetical protein
VVVWDNADEHYSADRKYHLEVELARRGVVLLWNPSYSPDKAIIELGFRMAKAAIMRRARERFMMGLGGITDADLVRIMSDVRATRDDFAKCGIELYS